LSALTHFRRDRASHRVSIQTRVALFWLSHCGEIAAKAQTEDFGQRIWIDRLSHDRTPHAGIKHLRMSEREAQGRFLTAHSSIIGQRIGYALFPTLFIRLLPEERLRWENGQSG
jgi:hypothetical protein